MYFKRIYCSFFFTGIQDIADTLHTRTPDVWIILAWWYVKLANLFKRREGIMLPYWNRIRVLCITIQIFTYEIFELFFFMLRINSSHVPEKHGSSECVCMYAYVITFDCAQHELLWCCILQIRLTVYIAVIYFVGCLYPHMQTGLM